MPTSRSLRVALVEKNAPSVRLLHILQVTSTRKPREVRSLVERMQDAHEDDSEALNETRAKSCWPRG
eukprot:CAMPEP_0172615686 /NCGR_PEP_ID=MMETSP1068-20121228/61879_1 /TAXON_ID=35684 /ORGANISM="Pseudopedinella elastica, Strain CCMP716" /LENGTH=66 /DNA_ID=CAMNT_0013420905 /DNA_START=53 /DNA_END=249 /DNA_ORIENTATION=-